MIKYFLSIFLLTLICFSCRTKNQIRLPATFSCDDFVYLEILEDSTYAIYTHQLSPYSCFINSGKVEIVDNHLIFFHPLQIDKEMNVQSVIVNGGENSFPSISVNLLYSLNSQTPVLGNFIDLQFSFDSISWQSFGSDSIIEFAQKMPSQRIIFKLKFFKGVHLFSYNESSFFSGWQKFDSNSLNTYIITLPSDKQILFRNSPTLKGRFIYDNMLHMKCGTDSVFNQLFFRDHFYEISETFDFYCPKKI
jgi:hypothetical protein